MLRITNVKVDVKHDLNDVIETIKELLNITDVSDVRINNKSIDARNKNNIKYVYSIDFNSDDILDAEIENYKNLQVVEEYIYPQKIVENFKGLRPVIIGTGPAGMFAGLILAQANLKPIIIERGESVREREKTVYNFFNTANLNVESNVQFGEGGAGTFSDGKLTTNTHNIRIQKVVEELIECGANPEIKYISKPHLGTDELIKIVENIRNKIENLGGKYYFNTKFIDYTINSDNELSSIKLLDMKKNEIYELETDNLILAIGHSARDTFEMLYKNKLEMSKKPFSMGVRIEHKQDMINKVQYGKYKDILPPAEYKLNARTSNNRGVYTFCMCPGGVVVPSASEKGRLVVNGMSYSKRDLENANSAVLVNIMPDDLNDHVLSGMYFQREIEEKAFILGGSDYKAPVQMVVDFINNKKTKKIGEVKPSYSIGYKLVNMNDLFPEYISSSLREGLRLFDNKIKGFGSGDAIITGVESRTSSPIRINRNENLNASIKGIIPSGEGAGYAGGIMSAAVDGIRCAEQVIENILNNS